MTEVYGEQAPAAPGDALGRLSNSARGWHAIQLAVLGFIGICGVLRTGDTTVPAGVQWLAGLLAVAALVFACAAVFLVGSVAFPMDAGRSANPAAVGHAAARLRGGVRLTVVALILAVIAALSGWWPKTGGDAGTAAVSVSDGNGRSWCGELVVGQGGAVTINTSSGSVAVPLQAVAAIRPVTGC